MELFKASRQWSSRPADERFTSLQELYDVTKRYADQAQEKDVAWDALRVEAVKDDVQLVGRANVPAKLTHWAFGQLCSRVGAPASYLRELPATLACQNLNHGLAKRVKEVAEDSLARLLFHANGGLLLRAMTTEKYSRIWNYEVAERLLYMETLGWEPAMPDVRADLDPEGPRPALYASDHDLFAFVRNNNVVVREPGNPDGLQRGIIVENSEVGAAALKLTRFLYREMCGNHIIWGASQVMDVSVRHVGDAAAKWAFWATRIREYAETSASDDEKVIKAAKHKLIAASKEEVLDALFGKRAIALSRKSLEAGYDAVVPDQDGDPRSVWGMVQGLTRYSQSIPYADQRTQLDRAAGKLLTVNF